MFQQSGNHYQAPRLVLYRGATRTGCGQGQSVMGPSTVRADSTAWHRSLLHQDMRDKLGPTATSPRAGVIAPRGGPPRAEPARHLHQGAPAATGAEFPGCPEPVVGQARTAGGLLRRVWKSLRWKKSRCWSAAIWKRRSTPPRPSATTGCSSKVRAGSFPTSFTHGTSAQRLAWFKRGFDSGKPASCDTFAAR